MASMARAGGLALVAAVSALAVPASGETLADALAAAYRTNPALASQRAGARAADEEISQARAQYGPTLTVSGGAGYERDRYLGNDLLVDRTQSGFTTNYAASVSQPVFTSGRLSAQLRAAEATADIGAFQLRDSEVRTLRETIAAYVAVRRNTRLVAIARENVDLLAAQETETAGRYKAGDVTEVDRQQSDNRASLARAQLADAEGALAASRERYAALVGHAPIEPLAPEPSLPPLPATIEQAAAVGERFNPGLLGAEARDTRAKADIGAARAERGPTVALQGAAQRGPVQATDNGFRQFNLIGRVYATLPLYTAGQVSSRIRQTLESEQQAALLVEQARRDMRQTIGQNVEALAAAKRAIPAYQQAALAAEKALTGAREQRRAGDLLTIYVLDQVRDLSGSRNAAAQAEADAYLNAIDLLAAMGTLDVAMFAPDVGKYDPQVHRERAERRGGTFYTGALQSLDRVTDDERVKAPTPADGPPPARNP